MGLTDFDPDEDESVLEYVPQNVTLEMLVEEIGGVHQALDDRQEEHCACVAEWLLNYATFETFGHAAAVYFLQLADCKIAIKAGIVLPSEAQIQDAVEKKLHLAPPVYSYLPNLELNERYHQYLCPFHGPLKRRKGEWAKDEAPCFCRYGMDFLIMPFCESYVPKDEVTPALEKRLMAQSSQIFEIARLFHSTPEVKSLMKLGGKIVFIDFGDVCDLDDLNILNPRYSANVDDNFKAED
jgi:hypothetical protein